MTGDEAVRIGWIGTGVMGAAMCGHLPHLALQAERRGQDGVQALVHTLAGLSSVEWPDERDLS